MIQAMIRLQFIIQYVTPFLCSTFSFGRRWGQTHFQRTGLPQRSATGYNWLTPQQPLVFLLAHCLSSLPPIIMHTQVLRKCFPGGFFGEDREGNPVWYDSVGNMDFRGRPSLIPRFPFHICSEIGMGLLIMESAISSGCQLAEPMCWAGLQRSVKKEDIVKLKIVHLETTVRVCKEFSKRVSQRR